MDAAAAPPPARDWSLLPLDALASVFVRLGAIDLLMGAGLVCRSWLDAAKLPDVWRVLVMEDDEIVLYEDADQVLFRHHDVLRAMAKAAVDRSGGQLREFAGKEFITNELVQYILERSPSLTTLRLVSCCDRGFGKRLASVIRESPLSELRSLELDFVHIYVGELTTVLENCPALEFLKVSDCVGIYTSDEHALRAKFSRIRFLIIKQYDYFPCNFKIHEGDNPNHGWGIYIE